jgi:hypothetical protein
MQFYFVKFRYRQTAQRNLGSTTTQMNIQQQLESAINALVNLPNLKEIVGTHKAPFFSREYMDKEAIHYNFIWHVDSKTLNIEEFHLLRIGHTSGERPRKLMKELRYLEAELKDVLMRPAVLKVLGTYCKAKISDDTRYQLQGMLEKLRKAVAELSQEEASTRIEPVARLAEVSVATLVASNPIPNLITQTEASLEAARQLVRQLEKQLEILGSTQSDTQVESTTLVATEVSEVEPVTAITNTKLTEVEQTMVEEYLVKLFKDLKLQFRKQPIPVWKYKSGITSLHAPKDMFTLVVNLQTLAKEADVQTGDLAPFMLKHLQALGFDSQEVRMQTLQLANSHLKESLKKSASREKALHSSIQRFKAEKEMAEAKGFQFADEAESRLADELFGDKLKARMKAPTSNTDEGIHFMDQLPFNTAKLANFYIWKLSEELNVPMLFCGTTNGPFRFSEDGAILSPITSVDRFIDALLTIYSKSEKRDIANDESMRTALIWEHLNKFGHGFSRLMKACF